MRLAVPLILREDLATSPNLLAVVVNDGSGAYQLAAARALRTTVEDRQGHISIQAVVTDMSTQRNGEVIRVEGISSGGLLPIANALAKRIDERASDFSTRNNRALQAFTAAAESANAGTRIQMLDEAIRVDPGFGLGYIVLAQTAAQTREQNVTALLQTAASHRDSFTPVDRARFNALAAQLTHAPLPQQEHAATAVLQLAPNDVDVLVALGSDRFLESDGSGGRRWLGRALELSPGNANIRNQLAQGLIETRQFADAEKILAAIDNNNPAILPELAACILLEGDEARANAIFEKYLAMRPPADAVTPVLHAAWIALTGQTTTAIGDLETGNFKDGNLRSVALTQTAIWQLMAKDFGSAKKNASLAAQPADRNGAFAAVGKLLSEGDRPPQEWRGQVDASALNDQAKLAILGYGFFLYGHYPEAAQVWQMVLQQSGGADLRARTMLAASLDRAGRTDEAHKILVQPFVPDVGDLYAAISFGEMRRLIH